jgi:hypothetical protein
MFPTCSHKQMELNNIFSSALYSWKTQAHNPSMKNWLLGDPIAAIECVPAFAVAFSNVAVDLLAIVVAAFGGSRLRLGF